MAFLPVRLWLGRRYMPLPKAELLFAGLSPMVTATSSPCHCQSDLHKLQQWGLPASDFSLGYYEAARAGSWTTGRE